MKIATHACLSVSVMEAEMTPEEQRAMSVAALGAMLEQLPEPETAISQEMLRDGFIRCTWEVVIPEEGDGSIDVCSAPEIYRGDEVNGHTG